MFRRFLSVVIVSSIAAFGLAGCGAGTGMPAAPADPALREQQTQAFVQAMKPRHARPVVAIVALNEGTETTDFLLTHAVLQRADVADVKAVAPRRGRVDLYPALQVDVAEDFDGFDRAHPSGADYVIVPAMSNDADPTVTAWLRRQAERGARIVGVCNGTLVVGNAGLLDGRRFAGHWSERSTVLERHPGSSHVPHQRYLVDRGVATTTGISASIPVALALVEAIGGHDKAASVAAELGATSWSPEHDSAPFALTLRRGASYLLNKAARFWSHEPWGVDVRDGMDDIALALTADAWSRTGRVSVYAESASPGSVVLRSGIKLAAQAPSPERPRLPLAAHMKPLQQLDATLCQIGERYGASRREWVVLEMEYADALAPVDSDRCRSS
ncbi:DJ-1/PfpI family protein [Hydrogenophaga sp. BPS33]|uniref:DJ-1/PfpI family protein n=1 Tax=Hydrogenophaga sp. BPS33 TaxID=2651974 RepID=UPI00131F80DE|nr:DJ-1/PfpI family protein [Hydrogenophaga sp. BPS33]QHE85224.1 thiamine biosynthesis protein ThiJ [Hydrogenophaga sp. BPS33]